ncbi:MAG: hypothetical protein C0617_00640 [Desulfuromonas sp.]|uniref:hypothetical protein n=1 Tax=Desulfuromonas sp. TaxID=892 RepID=UPI000CB9BB4B|nr:hypothetical protein [Desulfuromonas sp.]PLX86613.1 MAG: hypothetical protein C0617_00640 [Desulfuromonas sp.]
MGFFNKMFGNKLDYPDLDPAGPVAGHLEKISGQLQALFEKVHEPVEVVPGEDGGIVFIGKPPKKFGIAWIEGDRVINFKTLVDEHGVEPRQLQSLSDRLREIYEANESDDRYKATVGSREVVVHPSDSFRAQVNEAIESMSHH